MTAHRAEVAIGNIKNSAVSGKRINMRRDRNRIAPCRKNIDGELISLNKKDIRLICHHLHATKFFQFTVAFDDMLVVINTSWRCRGITGSGNGQGTAIKERAANIGQGDLT